MVKCAQCQTDWMARPQEPEIARDNNPELTPETVDEVEETRLDSAFDDEPNKSVDTAEKPEHSNVVAGPGLDSEADIDAVTIAKRRNDMAKRQILVNRKMPKARFKRGVRLVGVVILALLVLGGILLREGIVRTFPDIAGVYSSVGLGVNVVGLEFTDVKTLISLKNGVEMIDISASVSSIIQDQISVPPIIVTLLDGEGNSLYEWSVNARAAIMLPGEVIEMKTHLSSPPPQTKTVRLTFEGSK